MPKWFNLSYTRGDFERAQVKSLAGYLFLVNTTGRAMLVILISQWIRSVKNVAKVVLVIQIFSAILQNHLF